MKMHMMINPNNKGQIVIPKTIRDELNITSDTTLQIRLTGQIISIVPVENVILRSYSEGSYAKLLKKTQGGWAKDNKIIEKEQKSRRKIEIEASKKRKKQW